jgi:glucose-6-phosphate 1-dehydrogenase
MLVIFNGMGNLTWRKPAAALRGLLGERQLPDQFEVSGLDPKAGVTEEFRLRLVENANTFCNFRSAVASSLGTAHHHGAC